MATITIKIPPGIQRANTIYDIPNTWYDQDQSRWVNGTLVPTGGCIGLSGMLDSPARTIYVWENNESGIMTLAFSDFNVFVDTSGTFTNITPNNYSGPGFISTDPPYGDGDYGSGNYGSANGRVNTSIISNDFGYVSVAQWGEDIIFTSSADGTLYYYTQANVTVPAIPIGPSFSSVPNATVNASTIGTSFNVHTISSGNVTIGQEVSGPGIIEPVTVKSFGTGSGGTGTYTLSGNVGNIAASTMFTFDALTTGAPVGCASVVVTAERHVMAIGYNNNPYSIAWSGQEDPTDWNFANPTGTAGFLQLTSKTPLLYGMKVPEGVLVFSSTEVFLVRYVNEPFVYGGTDPIAYTELYNPRSIARIGAGAVWPSQRGFQFYTTGQVEPLMCPLQSEVFGTVGNSELQMDPTFGPFRFNGADLGKFSEVWWLYPTGGNSECNRYLIYNYVEGWWGIGTLARSCIATADAFDYPLMGGTNFKIYQHEFGNLNDGASRVGEIYCTSSIVPVGDGSRLMNATQAQIATGTGYNSINLVIYGRMTPEGTEYTKGPYQPRPDGYTDVRFQYRDIQVEIVNAQDGTFSMGEIRLMVSPGARR